jgi:hypothetical protein
VENLLVDADFVVHDLRQALKGDQWLSNVPGLLKRLIKEDLWRRRTIEATGEIVEFDRFVDLVTAPPLEGLGTTVDLLRRVCSGDIEAAARLEDALQEQPGAPAGNRNAAKTTDNNINNCFSTERESPTGTSRAAALRKLRKSAPELHAQVIAGELSPHAAMVQAGFRKPMLSIPADPDGAAAALRRNCDAAFIARLVELLQRG